MARELLPGADEATLAEVNLQLTARRSRAVRRVRDHRMGAHAL